MMDGGFFCEGTTRGVNPLPNENSEQERTPTVAVDGHSFRRTDSLQSEENTRMKALFEQDNSTLLVHTREGPPLPTVHATPPKGSFNGS